MAGELDDAYEGDDELVDWQLPLAFNEPRNTEKIEGAEKLTQTWRVKERVSLWITILQNTNYF